MPSTTRAHVLSNDLTRAVAAELCPGCCYRVQLRATGLCEVCGPECVDPFATITAIERGRALNRLYKARQRARLHAVGLSNSGRPLAAGASA